MAPVCKNIFQKNSIFGKRPLQERILLTRKYFSQKLLFAKRILLQIEIHNLEEIKIKRNPKLKKKQEFKNEKLKKKCKGPLTKSRNKKILR